MAARRASLTNETAQERLFQAVIGMDVEAAQHALADGAKAMARFDRDGASGTIPLLFVFAQTLRPLWRPAGGRPSQQTISALFDLLVEAGADPHACDHEGRTLWHLQDWADSGFDQPGYFSLPQRLMDAGVDVLRVDRMNNPPLCHALCTGQWSVAQVMVQAGATATGPASHPHRVIQGLMVLDKDRRKHHPTRPQDAQYAHWLDWCLEPPRAALNALDSNGRSLAELSFRCHVPTLRRLQDAGVSWEVPLSQATIDVWQRRAAQDSDTPVFPGDHSLTALDYCQAFAEQPGFESERLFYHALKHQQGLTQAAPPSEALAALSRTVKPRL